MEDSPHIYVASLSDYNGGIMYGAWIDATQDVETIREEVAAMLRGSTDPNVMVLCPDCDIPTIAAGVECGTCGGRGQVPSAEEWAIHDYSGFGGIRLGEYESFERVAALAEAVAEHGEAFAIFANDIDCGNESDVSVLVENFREAYQGEWDSEAAFAENLVDDIGLLQGVPEEVARYFDYESYARDRFIDGYSFHNGHVFCDY